MNLNLKVTFLCFASDSVKNLSIKLFVNVNKNSLNLYFIQ